MVLGKLQIQTKMLSLDSNTTVEEEPVRKYEQYRVKDTLFTVLDRYEILEALRSDSFGVAVAAKDNGEGKEWYDDEDELVSIKKLINIYDQ